MLNNTGVSSKMQDVYDDLFKKSWDGLKFDDLMSIVLDERNIFLAYHAIRSNKGSNTPGTDGKTIKDLSVLSLDDIVTKVRYFVLGSPHGYRPKKVRRKTIRKDNGSERPLGIPCIWDRLIQQCVKQVLEPICEAKFSENSFGFRSDRSVENAIALVHYRMNKSGMRYAVEFDIKGFFDNVNHSKLMKQLWALGVCDRRLLYIIRQMLQAPVKLENGHTIVPKRGTSQGGILSPLLANVVLNELDHWVDSQWLAHPLVAKYSYPTSKGSQNRGYAYRVLRERTKLKEMYIVRYADDFRIMCRTKGVAIKIMCAVTGWLNERLGLTVSPEKTRIVNLNRKSMEFLGFSIRLHEKGDLLVARSHVSRKSVNKQTNALITQIKNIRSPRYPLEEREEVVLFNKMVLGMQNYYRIATNVSEDYARVQYRIMRVMENRLTTQGVCRLKKSGRKLTKVEHNRYGRSQMLRYLAESKEPVYPIGYVQHKNPMQRPVGLCRYTEEGRAKSKVVIDQDCMWWALVFSPTYGRSIEFLNNKLSLFGMQSGKCAVTGSKFDDASRVHCHHKIPRSMGGSDKLSNLVLLDKDVHVLVHATDRGTIQSYLASLKLDKKQVKVVNKLRNCAGLEAI